MHLLNVAEATAIIVAVKWVAIFNLHTILATKIKQNEMITSDENILIISKQKILIMVKFLNLIITLRVFILARKGLIQFVYYSGRNVTHLVDYTQNDYQHYRKKYHRIIWYQLSNAMAVG